MCFPTNAWARRSHPLKAAWEVFLGRRDVGQQGCFPRANLHSTSRQPSRRFTYGGTCRFLPGEQFGGSIATVKNVSNHSEAQGTLVDPPNLQPLTQLSLDYARSCSLVIPHNRFLEPSTTPADMPHSQSTVFAIFRCQFATCQMFGNGAPLNRAHEDCIVRGRVSQNTSSKRKWLPDLLELSNGNRECLW